jgi:peptide/nickel transport system permease protein
MNVTTRRRELSAARGHGHQWRHNLALAARTPRGRTGLALVTFVVLVAAVGPFVAPYSPASFVTAPFSQPSGAHLLGGDVLGRDVLSRVLDGGWELLLMAVAATAFGVIVGGMAGISAAYLRGRPDGFIMRSVDVILAFPQIVLALLLVSVIGPKIWLVILAVGLSHAPQVARVLRSATLDISERDFVKAAELQGVPPARVMSQEILPNLVTPLTVEVGLRLTYSIVIMAGLSFLGFGIPPPAPNWGQMVSENEVGIALNVWGVAAPALLIAMLTIGTNTFTDAIARVSIGIEGRDESVALMPTVGMGS